MAVTEINSQGPILISVVIFTVAFAYLAYMLWLRTGWSRIPSYSSGNAEPLLSFSILIAARDEAKTLPGLLHDLEQQTYPGERFEVVIVDDHSEIPVQTLSAVRNCTIRNLKIITLPAGLEGKKQALKTASENSSFEYLLMTDADCRVQPAWISTFSDFCQCMDTDLVIGLVDQLNGNSFLSVFFRLDFLSLVTAGAGSAYLGHPTLCNGANLAVRKEKYFQYTGNLNAVYKSGDDVFLLHFLKKNSENQIRVLKNKDALVITRPPDTLRQFLTQRKRWASKSINYTDSDTIALGMLVFLLNFSLLFAFFISLAGLVKWFVPFLVFLTKFLADFILLEAGLQFFGKKKQAFLILPFQILYPFYIMLTVSTGFLKPYHWKNRRVK
jgi:poly-beta-1,6-N-acetyl-D-glucosamine synthase